MTGNRVEELEAKVRDLEATVDGLTDELVETKERLEAVEDETGIEPDALQERTVRRAGERHQRAESDDVTDAGATSGDGVNTEETDKKDNTDSESGDDIIVA